jgi:hypothetical protein
MRTYRFVSNGIEYVIEAENLTKALSQFRQQLNAS